MVTLACGTPLSGREGLLKQRCYCRQGGWSERKKDKITSEKINWKNGKENKIELCKVIKKMGRRKTKEKESDEITVKKTEREHKLMDI